MQSNSFVQSIIDTILGRKNTLQVDEPKPIKQTLHRLVEVKDLPDFMQGHERLKGVYVGGCILDPDGKWDKGVSAHAHCRTGDPGLGYICCMNEKKFSSKLLLKHELAHILSCRGHIRSWATVYVALKDPTNKWLDMSWLQKKYKFKMKKEDKK